MPGATRLLLVFLPFFLAPVTPAAAPPEAGPIAAVAPAPLTVAQATQPDAAPPPAPPTLAEVRADMGIPSRGLEMRGQRDTVGYAVTPRQMARVWELSGLPPAPDSLGPPPEKGVAAVLSPHDDYLYAGRVYRRVLPLITAPRVILIGVFHRYRRFGIHDRLVFDPYRTWRAPDGPVPVSSLREDLLSRIPAEDYVQDAASHDSEHSLEAQVFFLKHFNASVEIVPIIVPAAGFERLGEMATHLGDALADICRQKGWLLGRDVAIVISSDGVHYGDDFKYAPFGEGGVDTYTRAVTQDRNILLGPLAGKLTREGLRGLFASFVDPDRPDQYRLTWCGRFALPFGLLFLGRASTMMRQGVVMGCPVAYATSVGAPELPVRDIGLGETAPANLYHFVGLPAAAFKVIL